MKKITQLIAIACMILSLQSFTQELDDTNIFLRDLDKKDGTYSDTYNLNDDKNRFILQYHLNPSVTRILDTKSFEFQYAKRVAPLWISAFVAQAEVKFKDLGSNEIKTTTNPNDESKWPRNNNSIETLLNFGLGFDYQSNLIQELYQSSQLFDSISVFLTYNQLDDSDRKMDYSGFGLRCDYLLQKRISRQFAYGIGASYNYALLEREQLTQGEPKEDRSLSVSWVTLTAHLGYYF